MKLVGAGGQAAQHFLYDASGTIASNTAAQLVLPRRLSCSHLIIVNLSPTYTMYLDFGSARAKATVTSGSVTSIAVTNPGFGFSAPPTVRLRGGGALEWNGWVGSNDPNSPPAAHIATAHCVMSGTAPNMTVSSIVVDNPGSGYLLAPYVLIMNQHWDPNGCADASVGGGSGIPLAANGGSYGYNGTVCPTDQISVYAANGAGAAFACKWME